MAHTVPNLCVSRKVFLNHQVNWHTVCGAIQDLPCYNIWLADNPVEDLNEHLSLLVGRYVPTKDIYVRKNDKSWFDDHFRRILNLKQVAHIPWTRDHSRVNWEAFVNCQVRANEAYSESRLQFSDRNREVLMNVVSSQVVVHCYEARVRHCLHLLVRVADCMCESAGGLCVSRLIKLICCRIILTASSPGSLLMCRSPAISLYVIPPLPSGQARSGVYC